MSDLPPLLWSETQDDFRNSRFEAVSHIDAEPQTFTVRPTLEENRVVWRARLSQSTTMDLVPGLTERGFDTPEAAKEACETMEIDLGGVDRAPKVPLPNPDDAPPLTTDEHGYCPTYEVFPRFSRNDGVLYVFRVWAKPENPEQRIEKRLEGKEYDAAVESIISQHMVQTLVATITRPGGWIVALVWETPALGQVRLECEVHFAQARGLFQRLKPDGPTKELRTPSHSDICTKNVGGHLSRQREKFEKTLATTTEAELQRQIVKNARALGINSPMPVRTEVEQGVIPVELEDMKAGGVDLEGKALRTPKP